MTGKKTATKRVKPSSDHVRFYADMVATVECLLSPEELSVILKQIRLSGVTQPLPLEDDNAIMRFVQRLGSARGLLADDVGAGGTSTFNNKLADSVSRSPAETSVFFRLISGGWYGTNLKPVCGSTPLCNSCKLTKWCEYYNSRPADTTSTTPPAKRLARGEVSTLSDEELLSLLIGGKTYSKDHAKAAENLLTRHTDLRSLAVANYHEIQSLREISETVALRIAALNAIVSRINDEKKLTVSSIKSGRDFYELYYDKLKDRKQEIFIVVLLDQQNRIMKDEEISVGSLTSAQVCAREAFAPAVRNSAAAVAFIHNHPSGDCKPSREDIALTHTLCEAARLLGIRVLDHVIIGEGSYTSFVDKKLL